MRVIILFCFICLGLSPKSQTVGDSINKRKLAIAITAESVFYVGGMSYLGFVWYKDSERVPFHYYNDNAGYLQMDKMGHAYGSYLESKTCYNWLRASGVSKGKSLLFGGTMGIIMQTPIEVFDGLYKGWGFSWGDMIANSAGSALLIGQELLFDEQIIQYKFSFSRSIYADQSNGMLGNNTLESLFLDYNGHTYWLSANLNKVYPITFVPKWLNVAFGYSANGMFGEFENRYSYRGVILPEHSRYRQYFLSLDVDWTQISTDKEWLRQVFKAMNYIKLPFPSLEWNPQDKFVAHWLYF